MNKSKGKSAIIRSEVLPIDRSLRSIINNIASVFLPPRYRSNGDGGQALKLLLTFVKNVHDNPTDPK